MGRVADVEDFDEIEFQAARTGNHVHAAERMSELAQQGETGLRAEFHLRAGEQWMSADDPQRAAVEFAAAIDDGGVTFADPRAHLARALLDLGRGQPEAEELLAALTAGRDAVTPRTCDLLAELFTEQGDLQGALDWATTGVERCIQLGDDAELASCCASATGFVWTSASTRTTTTTGWTQAIPAAEPGFSGHSRGAGVDGPPFCADF